MLIAGVDEVGRGPLVGAVVAAAVIFKVDFPLQGMKDSKKLSAQKREELAEYIKIHCLSWSLGRTEAAEIDRINVHHASLLAMQRAVENLTIEPDEVLVDGKFCPQVNYPVQAIIKGDDKIAQISAASIIAKVARDGEMVALDKLHPQYGFAKHKGYPTKQHLENLQKYGVLPDYRRSFKPVARLLT